jgi:hypothetical protein
MYACEDTTSYSALYQTFAEADNAVTHWLESCLQWRPDAAVVTRLRSEWTR